MTTIDDAIAAERAGTVGRTPPWPKGPVGKRAIRLYRDLTTILDDDAAATVAEWATDDGNNGCCDGYAELIIREALAFGYADLIECLRHLADSHVADSHVAELLHRIVAHVEDTHPRAARRRRDRARRHHEQAVAS